MRAEAIIRLAVAALLAAAPISASRAEIAPIEPHKDALLGASAGERAAIDALCGSERHETYRKLCIATQIANIIKHGRKPDLTVATSVQRTLIDQACSRETIPAERFACERRELNWYALPVRDEPGTSAFQPRMTLVAARTPPLSDNYARNDSGNAKSPREHLVMPAASTDGVMNSAEVFAKVADTVYLVKAGEGPIEQFDRNGYTQGSAVAITDHLLVTNCHVVAGQESIAVSQHGVTSHATLIKADLSGDRCLLRADDMTVHPIHAARRFSDLRIGETVYSVGAPGGSEQKLGQGEVSALSRADRIKWVENSAPTSFGSSGGGLFDSHGNLIGITTAVNPDASELNFSIAAEDFWS